MAGDPVDPGHDPGPDVYGEVVPIRRLPPTGEERPEVRLTCRIHEVVPMVIAALATGACADADLYQRDGELVRVVRIAEPDVVTIRGKRTVLAEAGTPQIRGITSAHLRERVSASAQAMKFAGKEWYPCPMPKDVLAAIVDRAHWPGIRPIVGISETPILRPDFSIATERGYDAATSVVLAPSCDFPEVPAAPTQADANAALAVLHEAFADFPFSSPASLSVALAAVATIVARHAIGGAVPGFVLDASMAGSGKGLLANVIATIATGRVAPTGSFPRDDDAELEKLLGAYALRSPPLIAFDNITSALCGAPLDRALTAADTVEFRTLGRSEVPTLKWRAVVLVTGNQVEVKGDTTRRVLVARLEPTVENPELRTGFAHHPLLPWVLEHRPALVVAMLTLLRAWHVAGRPLMGCQTWGSFEEWAATVPPALVFAGAVDPFAGRLGSDGSDADDEKAALRLLLTRWGEIDADGAGVTAKELHGRLYPTDSTYRDGLDDVRDAMLELVTTRVKPGDKPTLVQIGHVLRAAKGRVISGQRLIASKSKPPRWSLK